MKPDYGLTSDMTPAEQTVGRIFFWLGAVAMWAAIVLALAVPVWMFSLATS